MKTHYKGSESESHKISPNLFQKHNTLCGLIFMKDDPIPTDIKENVDCKKCLRILNFNPHTNGK